MLRFHNYELLTAVTGKQALEIFAASAKQIAVLVLDLSLPDGDGEFVLEEIRKIAPDLPVIITTGSEDDRQQRRMEAAGVFSYLVKPYDLALLVKELARIV